MPEVLEIGDLVPEVLEMVVNVVLSLVNMVPKFNFLGPSFYLDRIRQIVLTVFSSF